MQQPAGLPPDPIPSSILEHLYNDLDDLGIRLVPYALQGLASQGATIELNGRYGIFLDVVHIEGTATLAGILAHEIGHCATGATHVLGSPYDLVEKHEYRANRWAIQRYLPYQQLCHAIHGGCHQVWQLAEYFQLPEDLVSQALTYYAQHRGLPLPRCPAAPRIPAPEACRPAPALATHTFLHGGYYPTPPAVYIL